MLERWGERANEIDRETHRETETARETERDRHRHRERKRMRKREKRTTYRVPLENSGGIGVSKKPEHFSAFFTQCSIVDRKITVL